MHYCFQQSPPSPILSLLLFLLCYYDLIYYVITRSRILVHFWVAFRGLIISPSFSALIRESRIAFPLFLLSSSFPCFLLSLPLLIRNVFKCGVWNHGCYHVRPWLTEFNGVLQSFFSFSFFFFLIIFLNLFSLDYPP